jgi:sugar phosphate isomerase/epimerase
MSFRLAAAELTLPGETLEEKFAFVRTVGFDGIELSARGDGIFGARIDELRRARDAGVLMPTAVVHMDHFIGDFDADRRRDAIEQLKIQLTTIAAAGGTARARRRSLRLARNPGCAGGDRLSGLAGHGMRPQRPRRPGAAKGCRSAVALTWSFDWGLNP